MSALQAQISRAERDTKRTKKALDDIEDLKDKVRQNGNSH